MPGNTTPKTFRYPTLDMSPDVPRDLGYLATDIDNYLTNNPGPTGATGPAGPTGATGAIAVIYVGMIAIIKKTNPEITIDEITQYIFATVILAGIIQILAVRSMVNWPCVINFLTPLTYVDR